MELTDPTLYINRELSWVRFNERVLEEALDPCHPLLERLKFLSIFGSNLDEFFMIRMSGLYWQMQTGSVEAPLDGRTPEEQIRAIQQALAPLLAHQAISANNGNEINMRSASRVSASTPYWYASLMMTVLAENPIEPAMLHAMPM